MPRTKRQITSDAHAAGRVVDDAQEPLRFEEIRRRLRVVEIVLSVKQARRTLELAERLGLVDRVNRSRWGRVGLGHLPPAARRSMAGTVIDVAARLLLELPPSTELHRAVRQVLRLATEQARRPVLSHRAPEEASVLPATTPPTPASAVPERKANGANERAGQVEVLVGTHS